ncbi:MAG: single-stranded DNA-binding protein [Acidobacteria bacterium]|nr:single-stranded DNA-binding protein [Acidobacteriota bacterium]
MINKVILVGRLGKDPEVRSTPSGQTVTEFSLATDEKYTDKSGNKVEKTEWHNIQAWGRLGEICGQYLRKGKLVYIEGRIQTDSWDDKETGQKRYKTRINANEMKMLGGRSDGESGGYENSAGSSSYRKSASEPARVADGGDDDDVPF